MLRAAIQSEGMMLIAMLAHYIIVIFLDFSKNKVESLVLIRVLIL